MGITYVDVLVLNLYLEIEERFNNWFLIGCSVYLVVETDLSTRSCSFIKEENSHFS